MEPVIDFNNVDKEYPLYHHIGSGIKDLIFHPKRAFQLLKGRKYLAIQMSLLRLAKSCCSLGETA